MRANDEAVDLACECTRLVEQTEAHVVIRLLLLLLLLLLSLLLSSSTASGGATSSGRCANSDGTTTCTNVGEHLFDVLALKRLGEKGGPDRLELDLGGSR